MATLEDLAPRLDALEARLGPVGDLAIGRLAVSVGRLRGSLALARRLRALAPWPVCLLVDRAFAPILAEIDQQARDVARALADLGH